MHDLLSNEDVHLDVYQEVLRKIILFNSIIPLLLLLLLLLNFKSFEIILSIK